MLKLENIVYQGTSIVVMDSDEYKEKVVVLLNDTKTI